MSRAPVPFVRGSIISKLIFKLVAVSIVLVVMVAGVDSLPRLSVEQSLPCRTCHINPNGGGMRTEFGNHAVALHELCLPATREIIASRKHSPRVAPALLVGFDSRYLIRDDYSVFRMQTDFYADINPWPQFHYALRFSESGISESYALLYFHDDRYYVKLGRFCPAYGLRDADHTAYVRSRTGLSPTLYQDGLSLGAVVEGVNLVGEVFDVSGQSIVGAHAYFTGSRYGLGALGGASVRMSERVDGKTGAFPHLRSLFGGLSWDRFTLMGEAGLSGFSADTLVTFASLTSRLTYGLYLVGEYSFFDGDRRVLGEVDEFVRLSCELFPLPYIEVRPSYTYYTRGILEATDDFFVQVHIGY